MALGHKSVLKKGRGLAGGVRGRCVLRDQGRAWSRTLMTMPGHSVAKHPTL